jgi:hypothetical protein
MASIRSASSETDRALVEAMAGAGEPPDVVEDFLLCLDRTDAERDELRRVAASTRLAVGADIARGDVVEMNPLTSQPQRAKPR